LAEIVPVVSEALEAQVRDLLPSQRGFGEDLQASNVITPIIDLTAAAQGTSLDVSMQQAIAFGSQTAFLETSSSSTIINNTGFYRVFGTFAGFTASASTRIGFFDMTDGLSTKRVWQNYLTAGAAGYLSINFDFIVFIAAGESLVAGVNESGVAIAGSTRQIADVNGNLVNPSGFVSQ